MLPRGEDLAAGEVVLVEAGFAEAVLEAVASGVEGLVAGGMVGECDRVDGGEEDWGAVLVEVGGGGGGGWGGGGGGGWGGGRGGGGGWGGGGGGGGGGRGGGGVGGGGIGGFNRGGLGGGFDRGIGGQGIGDRFSTPSRGQLN